MLIISSGRSKNEEKLIR